jgi:hypothetical protein
MGVKGIRTALKVDLEKHAREQPGLHVSRPHHHEVRPGLTLSRTDGILTVCQSLACPKTEAYAKTFDSSRMWKDRQ